MNLIEPDEAIRAFGQVISGDSQKETSTDQVPPIGSNGY